MASWIDIFALVTTIVIVGAIIYGISYVVDSVNAGLHSTKESLKSKGLEISSSGVSVKTSSRYTREDQIDATQRHLVRAIGASSFRKGESFEVPEHGVPLVIRQSSTKSESSIKDNESGKEKKKKRRLFGSAK